MKILTGIINFFYLIFLSLLDLIYFLSYPQVLKLKLGLFWLYFLDPAYRVIKREGERCGLPPEDLIYGEAPFFTLKKLFKQAGLKEGDAFLDLGSGRGVCVLFAALFFGAKACGIEILPELVKRGEKLEEFLGLKDKVKFIAGDFRKIPLPESRVVYFSASTLGEGSLKQVAEKLKALPSGSRIISLSFAFPGEDFKLLKKERHYFSWGRATVYYQLKGKAGISK